MISFVTYALVMICFPHERILALTGQKFVYQKDVSEHCRRRVMPSIFLGRHVVDANSQILHFTRLELPYSCFISVRSESGSNLILVIQMVLKDNIISLCSKNGDQLMVYEMSETFGGYWGPLPDSLIKRDRTNITKFYTLKTTQPPELSSAGSEEYDETVENTPESVVLNFTTISENNAEFITMDLPIVNVSGKLIPGEVPRKSVYNIDDSFDLLYDVTPRRGMSYDTSIIPLVQFSLKKNDVQWKNGEAEYKYYNLKPFTPDERPLPTILPHYILTNFTIGMTTENTYLLHQKIRGNISWDLIDNIMKSFDKTASTARNVATSQFYKNTSDLFQNILDTRHNFSVYLSPNLSIYYKDVPLHASVSRKSMITSENSFQVIKAPKKNLLSAKSTFPVELTYVSNALHSVDNRDGAVGDTSDTTASINATTKPIIKTTASFLPSYFVPKRDENLNSSLVDRESWDNVVQVAPVMAGILYHLKANQTHNTTDSNVTSNINRKKRYIKSVPVENARPHNITTKGDAATTAAAKYVIADVQDFAQLVEIQDDELHGRVALRYLRRYVGPALLNICDSTDTATRHVYLFNSSRIVLAISNFTMDSMTVIVTPAHTVTKGDGHCPDDHLECQVSGARVCIDSLTACDGIPNCGSYEIYDEDRLMCGAAIGLQHNVYLAAFTFLAVLLTTLYGVHYWLKRCVPKVSEAFFLYTDGSENVLYLDTIMRSPTDDEDASKMCYQGNILDDDLLIFADVSEVKKSNRLKRFLKSFFSCKLFRKKRKKKDAYDSMAQEGLYVSLEEKKKTYSYTELELRKILETERFKKDIAVQTSYSLEMSQFAKLATNHTRTQKKIEVPQSASMSESLLVLNDNFSLNQTDKLRSLDELSILNFLNSSNDSSKSKSLEDKIKAPDISSIVFEEKEIKSHSYDHKLKIENISTMSKLANTQIQAKGQSERSKKHLRFEEEAITIPSNDQEDESDEEINENLNRRRSVVLGVGRSWRKRDLDSIEEIDESTGNIHGKSIRFWGKSKKTKK